MLRTKVLSLDDVRNAIEGPLEPIEVNQDILKFVTLV